MNSGISIPSNHSATTQRVEFFRLPAPGKRDPFFGLSRGWYYKAAAVGEIRMVVAYDSVLDYIRRSMAESAPGGALLGGLQPIAPQDC
jgi:hypothetical protein